MHAMMKSTSTNVVVRWLLVLILTCATLVVLTSVDAAVLSAFADDGGYPWASAPCEFTGGGTSCVNPNNSSDKYDWYVDENSDGHFSGNPCGGASPSSECFDQWGYEYRNCTSFVAWKINQIFGVNLNNWGSATYWDTKATTAGFTLDTTPQVGDIAQWDSEPGNSFGHVAYVSAIDGSGVATFQEYNQGTTGAYSNTRTSATASPDHYIHIGTIPSSTRAIPSDFDFNSKSDVAMYSSSNSTVQVLSSTGSGFTSLWNSSGWGTPTMAVEGDFTGDGKSDLLWLEPSGGSYVAEVMASTGSGFTNAWNNFGWGLPTWIGVGYFDSDNKADVAIYTASTPNGPVLQVLKSTGTGFTPLWNTYGWGNPTKAVVGDFNGDGMSDLLWLEPSGGSYVAEVMASTGSGFTNAWNNFGWGLPTWMADE
jgi:surface antigen